MSKKVIFIFLLSILPSIILCHARENNTQPSPGEAIFVSVAPTDVQINDKIIQDTSDEWIVKIHTPQLKGLSNQSAEKKINKYLEKRSEAFQKEARKIIKDQRKSRSEKIPYEVISHFTVKESLEDLLVIHILDYLYVGGEKGIATPSYVVVDLKENKYLTLEDLFYTKSEYKKHLTTLLVEVFDERQNNQYIINEAFFERTVFKATENFCIDDYGNLTIIVKMKDLAPAFSGHLTFVLEKEKIPYYKF